MKEFIDSHNERLSRIEGKLGDVSEKLAVYNAHLGEHMRRTEAAERGLEKLNESLEPVQRHVHYVEGALKVLGLLSLTIGTLAGAIKIFEYLST